jgi:hypothetical protein
VKPFAIATNGFGLGDGLEFETRQPVTEAKLLTKSKKLNYEAK